MSFEVFEGLVMSNLCHQIAELEAFDHHRSWSIVCGLPLSMPLVNKEGDEDEVSCGHQLLHYINCTVHSCHTVRSFTRYSMEN